MDGDVDRADQLLRNADLAMYRAKAAGQGGHARYDPQPHTERVQRVQREADLTRALDARELFFVYQPTIDLASGQMVGAETLVRWQHRPRGLVPPTEVIPWPRPRADPAAGAWVLREACHQAAAWPPSTAHHDKPLALSINLSGRQLHHAQVNAAAAALGDSGLEPDALVLEMTKSALLDDDDTALAILGQRKGLGARLAIDDFGTGYSSSATRTGPRSTSSRSTARSGSGSATPATTPSSPGPSSASATASSWSPWPRVEDSAQSLALPRTGCDIGQSSYHGRPMDPGDMDPLVGHDAPAPARKPAATG